MSPTTGIIILITISLALTSFVLRIWMNWVLDENGYEFKPLFSIGRDMLDMASLIGETKDIKLKRKYRRLLRSAIFVNVLLFCAAIVLINTVSKA